MWYKDHPQNTGGSINEEYLQHFGGYTTYLDPEQRTSQTRSLLADRLYLLPPIRIKFGPFSGAVVDPSLLPLLRYYELDDVLGRQLSFASCVGRHDCGVE
jgi:hypothetical protein